MKATKIIIAAIATLSLSTAVMQVRPVAAANTKTEITQKNKEILAKIEDEDQKYGELADQVSAKTDAIATADKQITSAKAKIARLQTQISKEKKEVKSRVKTMRNQLVSLQKEAGDSITGNVYADFILNSKNLSDLISRGTTVSKLNNANQESLQQVKDAKAKLAGMQADQQAAENKLEDTKQTLVADKTKLIGLQKTATSESKKLNKMLDDNKALLASISAAEVKAAAETAKKAAAASAKVAAVKASASKATAKQVTTDTAKTATTTPKLTTSSTKKTTPATSSSNNKAASKPDDSSYSAAYGSAIAAAESQLGKPYVWGAAGPSSYDCSGLTMWAFAKIGISLPHSAALQSNMGTRVSVSQLQTGDLVFWGSPAHHVGIYIGGGRFIHAPHTGDVVKITSISSYTPDYGVRL